MVAGGTVWRLASSLIINDGFYTCSFQLDNSIANILFQMNRFIISSDFNDMIIEMMSSLLVVS